MLELPDSEFGSVKGRTREIFCPFSIILCADDSVASPDQIFWVVIWCK